MFSILRRNPQPVKYLVLRSEDGFYLTFTRNERKACVFTDAKEAQAVAEAMNGKRHRFHSWTVHDAPEHDPANLR